MWGITILADFRPMGYNFHAVVVFGLGKNFLFKSVLGHCGPEVTVGLTEYLVLHNGTKLFIQSHSKLTREISKCICQLTRIDEYYFVKLCLIDLSK